MNLFEKHPELKEAWEKLKPYCIEVDYIDSGAFQAGEEETFLKGGPRLYEKPCFVFSPEFEPYDPSDE